MNNNLSRFTTIIFVCISLVSLTACSSLKTKEMQEVIVDNRTKTAYVFPEDKYLIQCKELQELKSKKIADLYRLAKDEYPEQYYKCSDDKDVLAEWILRFKKDIEKN